MNEEPFIKKLIRERNSNSKGIKQRNELVFSLKKNYYLIVTFGIVIPLFYYVKSIKKK